MNKLYVQEPVSGGILLSYKCSNECKHCMYACSPQWRADWLSEEDAEKVLAILAGKIQASPYGPHRIGINHGLHFTGGEPFLNFDLLLKIVKIAEAHTIPSTFVETNCFWCIDEETTRTKLLLLKGAGLKGVLISVNPFILEDVPFERTEIAVRIGEEVFGRNIIIYQEFFYHQFKRLELKGTMPFKEYITRAKESLSYIELIPMGRAVYKLDYLFRKFPARSFFSKSCTGELTRPWHVHIDNYCNYMTGYCGGISLGNIRNLELLCKGIDLNKYPIFEALATDMKRLYELSTGEFGYTEEENGYISKCHLCVDIRKHLVQRTDQFKELNPKEFYFHLN